MSLQEKFKQYTADEKILFDLEIDKKTDRWMIFASILFVISVLSVIPIIFTIVLFALLSIPPDTSSLWCLFVGGGSIAAMCGLLHKYFTNWVDGLRYAVAKKIRNNAAIKQLKQQSLERKQFFQFYELMQDADYQKAYFETLRPDFELIEKMKVIK
jgi:hypothetical protein